MDWGTSGFPVHHQHPELDQTHAYQVSDAIQPSHPLLSPSPPAFSLFQWVSSSHPVAKIWSFSFSISSSKEYSRLISFRIDWFDFLTAQKSLRSLLQQHNLKALVLWCSVFFMVQLSHCTWLLEKPELWLYISLLAKWHPCFLTCCLGLSQLFFQGERAF